LDGLRVFDNTEERDENLIEPPLDASVEQTRGGFLVEIPDAKKEQLVPGMQKKRLLLGEWGRRVETGSSRRRAQNFHSPF